jgi:hypothetical protein
VLPSGIKYLSEVGFLTAMSTFFPQVNIPALKKFAVSVAVKQHPVKAPNRRHTKVPTPVVASVEDVKWAGEKVRLIISK